MKINPDTQIILDENSVEITANEYSVLVDSYSEVAEGIANTVIHIDGRDNNEYFLKYYKTTHALGKVATEISLVADLEAMGLPVPEYLTTQTGSKVAIHRGQKNNHLATLTRKLPGSHPNRYSAKTLTQLGAAHATIHTASLSYSEASGVADFNPIENYNFYKPSIDESDLLSINMLADSSIARLANYWGKLPTGLVPMDIKRDNILVENDNLSGIIDFADTNFAPLSFCLAGVLWDVIESDSGRFDRVAQYLEAYESHRVLTDLERKLLMEQVFIRGWITLHGILLTEGVCTKSQEQMNMLQGCIDEYSLFT